MLAQILIGALVSAVNIVIHALLTVSTIRAARDVATRRTLHPWLRLVAIMIATMLVLMAAHTTEVFVWSVAYALAGVAPEGSDLVYFSFVNYTTLGYGDITPVAARQLLAPITAMNGVLLFGWSTAVIFEVLRKTVLDHPPIAAPP
jgi:TRAP-type C4-dicarboxylate transport system permease large subunit